MADATEPLRTPLYEAHRALGARLVDFAGWQMPLLYKSILDEHAATRTDATVFDVSHMGRLRVTGGGAWKLLAHACTAEAAKQEDDTARYSLLCNEKGGIVDDLFLLRLEEGWIVVSNAANRLKVREHLAGLNEQGAFGAVIEDTTPATAMLAVQGPNAIDKLAEALPFDIRGVGRHGLVSGTFMVFPYVASRSGYTGEDGFEVILPAMVARKAWDYLVGEGGVSPAGLGARDVLRLEAGLPLYGHELNETIDPLTAGLSYAVRKEGGFVGAEAIQKVRDRGPARKRVGLRLQGPRIARQGATVLAEGTEVGVVTSGTFSPSVEASIALAYVDRRYAMDGQALTVQVRPKEDAAAEVVHLPFYRGSAWK